MLTNSPLYPTASPPFYSIEPHVYITSSSQITGNSLLAERYMFTTLSSISLWNSHDSLTPCHGLRPSMNLLANLLAKVRPYPSYHSVQPDDLNHWSLIILGGSTRVDQWVNSEIPRYQLCIWSPYVVLLFYCQFLASGPIPSYLRLGYEITLCFHLIMYLSSMGMEHCILRLH